MPHLTLSPTGLALTQQFEGLRLIAYPDSGGVWTIGYGHTGPDVHAGQTITETEAEALLREDMAAAQATVNQAVSAALEQHHFDALVDFTFNVGAPAFRRSTLLRLVNAGNFTAAANEFAKWTHVDGKPVPGLLRRREAEAALFRGDLRPPETSLARH